MPLDPAAIVRTLAAGHRPAHPHLLGHDDEPSPVPAVTDPNGAPVLLLRNDSAVADHLRNLDDGIALRYDDRPPVPDAPWLGSAWICGWAEPVSDQEVMVLAAAFADRRPVTELFGLGDTHSLWRIEPVEVRLEDDEGVFEIEVEHYVAATADTWYPLETNLIMDLTVHHIEALDGLLHRIRHQIPDADHITPLRMDGQGTVIDVHCRDGERRRFLVRHHRNVMSPSHVLHSLACCACNHD